MRKIKKIRSWFLALPTNRKLALIHALIFICTFTFFIIGIDRHAKVYFDEELYVPGAMDLIYSFKNSNWSHPPLGKLIIGLGIAIFGDNPFGWRVMGVVFGALSLNAMFSLGLIFFESEVLALEVTALCFLNQLLFVLSRAAILDVIMFTFMAWGFVFAFKNSKRQSKRQLTIAALFFGLAVATKWFAVVAIVIFLGLYLARENLTWKKRLKAALSWLGYSVLGYFAVMLVFLVMRHPRETTFATFSSDFKYTVVDLLSVQWGMLQAQLNFTTLHPFISPWYQWPFGFDCVIFDQTQEYIKGIPIFTAIMLLGDPLIIWLGGLSIGVCLYAWLRKKSEKAKIIFVLYAGLFLSWAIIPRKITFYFYYFPAAMILSLSLVFAFQFLKIPAKYRIGYLCVCVLVFAYFYPLLTWVPVQYNDDQWHPLFTYWGWKHPIPNH